MRIHAILVPLVVFLALSSCSKDLVLVSDKASLVWLEDQGLSTEALENLAHSQGYGLRVILTEPGSVQNVAGELIAPGRYVLISPLLARFLDYREGFTTFPDMEAFLGSSIDLALSSMADQLSTRIKESTGLHLVVDSSDPRQIARAEVLERFLIARFPDTALRRSDLASFGAGHLGPVIAEAREKKPLVIFLGLLRDIQVLRDLAWADFDHVVWGLPRGEQPWPSCVGTFYLDAEVQFRQILTDLSRVNEKTSPGELVKFNGFK